MEKYTLDGYILAEDPDPATEENGCLWSGCKATNGAAFHNLSTHSNMTSTELCIASWHMAVLHEIITIKAGLHPNKTFIVIFLRGIRGIVRA